jgi:diguanylate cyclase (GGDEF)-like protein
MVKKVKNMGKWTSVAVMLTASVIWMALGDVMRAHPVPAFYLLALNGLAGLGLGYWVDRVYAASLRDDLTPAYNRRFLTRMMPSLLARSSQRNTLVSVTLIDCDDFKKINDEYGHNTGDKGLQVISLLLIGNTRRDDYVVRWGGDEFLVIAANTDYESTRLMVDRLEVQLRSMSGEMSMPLSVSAGIAVYPEDASKLEDLIGIADHRMYEDKHMRKEAASAVS